MAENAVIGALRVVLGADTGQLEDGLKKGSESLKNFGRDVAAVAAGVGLEKFVEKVAESFTHLIKQSIETADQMHKMSQKIGISVESLSGLTVSATLSDLSVEELSKSMAKLNKNMVAAAAGGTNDAAAAIQYLGLSAKQLLAAGPDVALQKISDKFAQMENGANKTAVAIALFGRAGFNLIPLLNQGGKSMQEMTRTAQELGLVISSQTAKQSEEFMDNLKLLGLAVQGVGLTVAKYFVPSMADASKGMVKWVVDGKIVTTIAENIVRAFVFVMDNAKLMGVILAIIFSGTVIQGVTNLGLLILNLGRSLVFAAASSLLLAARLALIVGVAYLAANGVAAILGKTEEFNKLIEGIAKGENVFAGIGKSIHDALTAAGVDLSAFTGQIKLSGDSAHEVENAIKNAFSGKNFDPKAAENAKKLGEEILKVQLNTRVLRGELDLLAPSLLAQAERLNLITPKMTQWSAAQLLAVPGVKALNDALIQQNIAATADPYTKLQQSMTNLTTFMSTQGVAGADAWGQAVKKNAMQAADSIKQMSDDMIGGWQQLFSALGKENKGFFVAGQALAITMAVINTAQAVTKALATYPPPFSYAAAAAAAAAGLAQIVTIKQQKYTGAAMGGMFKVPGGSMGVDTKMVSMALAPGELVEVTPAGKASGGGDGKVLEIAPINPRDFFTGDTVRYMVQSIDKWMRDGGTGIRMVQ